MGVVFGIKFTFKLMEQLYNTIIVMWYKISFTVTAITSLTVLFFRKYDNSKVNKNNFDNVNFNPYILKISSFHN